MRTFEGVSDLLPLAAAFPERYPGLLESPVHGPHARHDILFGLPREALILHRDGRVRDELGNDRGPSFLDALDRAWCAEQPSASAVTERGPWQASRIAPIADSGMGFGSSLPPFRGGWLLFLAYELGAEIEKHLRLPPAPDSAVPLAMALRCRAAIVVDRIRRQTHLLAETGDEGAIPAMRADLATTQLPEPVETSVSHVDEDDPQRFVAGVAAIHERLHAGDVFQANLSREWRVRVARPATPASVFASLRRANPAPFSALLQRPEFAVVSSSPERLVNVRGDAISTRPIAGTRARHSGDDDAARLRELIGHPKERAEHVMLIDLERNDLGRVSVPGSVIVDELMTLESYAHVHHIVSNVRGRLRPGTTPGAIIRAVFPGGTITGCPKVRTMQIIAQLEGTGRGAYTGSLGYLNLDGDLDLNILIRSMTMCGQSLRFRAGAGIVADSIAERELDETRAKARGLLRALGLEA